MLNIVKMSECLVTPLLVAKFRNGKKRDTKTFLLIFLYAIHKNPEKVLRGKWNNRKNNNRNKNNIFASHFEISF